MRSISEIIDRYEGVHERDPEERAVTTRISAEAMLKLETLAAHFGQKKTPLAGEILEAAVHEIFEGVTLDEGLERDFAEEMSKLQQFS